MRHQIIAAAVTLAIPLGLLSGCGQKGPLYLPPRNGTVVTRPQSQPTPSPQTSTPDDSDKKKNDSDSSPKPN